MRRNRQKKQNFSQRGREKDDWTVKPLSDSPLKVVDHHQDDVEHPQTSNFMPSDGIKVKWVSKNRVSDAKNSGSEPEFEVGELDSGPKSEVAESSSAATEGGKRLDERESEAGERICGIGEKVLVGISEGSELSKEGNGVDDVVRRLEELQFEAEEVGISEEQIKINDQAQEDELLAMESIYGDNVYVLEKRRGLRSFQIHIHIELPGAYSVSAKLKEDTLANSKVCDSDDFLYTFKVQYLPPIILTCLLPKSYPSHCPPSFTISVQWLHESRISKLCSMLDLLWNEQAGQEILYQWVEWLHSSSLSYLGSDEELLLGPYNVKSVPDRRAFSGSLSPDIDIPSMRSYNEERVHENFLSGCHECCICFSEYAGTEFLRLPCHHFFCVKCMTTYADVHVKEGTVNKLQCPSTKCGGMIPPGLLKRLLGDEEFQRWESLVLQKSLDAMPDVAYCPRCETPCLEDDDQHAQCSKCFFSFCSLCREKRHVGIACMTPEMKLKFLEERQNSSLIKDEQRRKELDMINELRSVKEILRDAKQCPNCKIAISRTEGCNKMVCTQCGKYFCYRCSKAISGYEHFREEGGCQLFPQEAIVQWEEQVNARQVLGQIQAQMFAANARPCPGCKQLNAKMGNNNHIFCWACQNHYCYLCRKMVRRSSEHYGPKGCKQHSEG
ncbi:hypothetical protein SOVF_055230 [Spinacia oleracea]|uniref:RBR-type E3 ubiquitin transferase n=1 Tax=Spinacia oleracea TaxID=3562 RepID=A0A9R0JZH5_SPIOL|nr:uncharacterized protein LOC110791826 [Spinacia oleracea]KNA20123.1 hypothetical protein SOVF_055230 [Spinacia oleracea]